MEAYRQYLTKLISQKQKEGLIPDLGPGAERTLANIIPDIFGGVSTEDATTVLEKLQELLRRMEDASGTESRP